jgi:predicted DCC family thiol-disulfide oxidoreductase YuxK
MSDWPFKLLYDGACPFCRREVSLLRRLNRHNRLEFEDVTLPEFDPSRYGRTREELLGVIHGVFPDGRIVSKVEASRQMYRAVGLGWLVAPTSWPVLRWIFDRLYLFLAHYRIPLGRFFGRSCTSDSCRIPHSKK